VADDLLAMPRRFPHSVRVCDENIQRLETEARTTLTRCEREKRDPTVAESARFDEICDVLAPAWKHEKRLAEQYRAAILDESKKRLQTAIHPSFQS
jgi:hypothetical protein